MPMPAGKGADMSEL